MQEVESAFSVEGASLTRRPAHGLQVAWKKGFLPSIQVFTIGVSAIGGNDVIPFSTNAALTWQKYEYFDESETAMDMSWERMLSYPLGGAIKAMADFRLDNTSGRYTPYYMGGNSELFTAILPRRPVILNAGFNYGGVDHTLPQFVGLTTKTPDVNERSKTAQFEAADFMDFIHNKGVDQTTMYTGLRSDEIIENLLQSQGFSTADYELDIGLNTINFGVFEKGHKLGQAITDIVQAEQGHFYQDETGKLKFVNRSHWAMSPFNQVQRIIATSQVIDSNTDQTDHIVNVVEVRSIGRQKQPLQSVFNLPPLSSIEVPANSSIEQFFEFEDPILQLVDPTNGGINSYFVANTAADESGTDKTSSITFTNQGTFTNTVKYRITNSFSSPLYVTQLVISARIAKKVSDVYVRLQDDSSVTAFEERPVEIDNPFVQSEDWAESLAQIILNDFAEPDRLVQLTIRALPELQLGDLVSWQGRTWQIYGYTTRLDPAVGFVQDINLLQRDITAYFQIGVSLIGGTDKIAP